jgi:hypothetical protein
MHFFEETQSPVRLVVGYVKVSRSISGIPRKTFMNGSTLWPSFDPLVIVLISQSMHCCHNVCRALSFSTRFSLACFDFHSSCELLITRVCFGGDSASSRLWVASKWRAKSALLMAHLSLFVAVA